jgi:hypothetical protein
MNEWNLKKRKNNARMVYLKKVKIKFTAPDPCVASIYWMRRKKITSTFITDLHLISHLLFTFIIQEWEILNSTVLQNWWQSFN